MAILTLEVDDEIVQALKLRAAEHGISMETEHQRILEQELLSSLRKPFNRMLMEMPNFGEDSDFER